jgi:hypothetical protein
LQVPDLGRVQGTVGFRTATELLLQGETENRTIRLAAVDTLWVRGRRTKAGAIIGGILGIGGGILLGAVGMHSVKLTAMATTPSTERCLALWQAV